MKLNKEIAEHYELVGWKGGPVQVFGRFGIIDLDKLTLKQARRLERMGFAKLKPKPAKKQKPANEPGKGNSELAEQ
jgi:hypothetical protein